MLSNSIKSINAKVIYDLSRKCVSSHAKQTSHQSQSDENVINRSSYQLTDDQIQSSGEKVESDKRRKKIHPFKNLYCWKSLNEFTDLLEKRIVYNDRKLIAIDKPWGVGYHKANKTIYKPYSFETLSMIAGEPKFCINDALPQLTNRLGLDTLEYVKTIDRYSSGIILLSGDKKEIPNIRKSLNTNKSEGASYHNFACIAQGFPAIDGDELSEKVRIKLRDIDELADYKEPIIEPAVYKKQDLNNGYLARVCIKINKIDRINSSSYLRISTNRLRWNFVRCYVAHKAAFIIGDLRFSANVKRILGQQVLETTNSFYRNDQIEPLNPEILKALRVKSNKEVPIMLHHESIILKRYNGKDLEISCELPQHFTYALKKLKLIDQPLNDTSM